MNLTKRILLELLITPWTVVPILAGGSLLLLAEVLGGTYAFLGFMGVVAGLGAFFTNLVFNLDNVSKKALKQWQKQQTDLKEKELDALDKKLKKTDGDEDENALRNLRVLYKAFCGDVSENKLSANIPQLMFESIEDIFETCVAKLDRSYEIYKTAKTMNGKLKKSLMDQRVAIISEVENSVHNLADVINETRALKYQNEDDELQKLQRKLAGQLEVAKSTESEMSAFMSDSERIDSRLSEYE